jgi:hypothetical protein
MPSTVPVHQSLKTRLTLTTLTIVLLSLWSLSYYTSQMLHDDMVRTLGQQQLSSVARWRRNQRRLQDMGAASRCRNQQIRSFWQCDGFAALAEQLAAAPFQRGFVACGLDGSAIAMFHARWSHRHQLWLTPCRRAQGGNRRRSPGHGCRRRCWHDRASV